MCRTQAMKPPTANLADTHSIVPSSFASSCAKAGHCWHAGFGWVGGCARGPTWPALAATGHHTANRVRSVELPASGMAASGMLPMAHAAHARRQSSPRTAPSDSHLALSCCACGAFKLWLACKQGPARLNSCGAMKTAPTGPGLKAIAELPQAVGERWQGIWRTALSLAPWMVQEIGVADTLCVLGEAARVLQELAANAEPSGPAPQEAEPGARDLPVVAALLCFAVSLAPIRRQPAAMSPWLRIAGDASVPVVRAYIARMLCAVGSGATQWRLEEAVAAGA